MPSYKVTSEIYEEMKDSYEEVGENSMYNLFPSSKSI